MPNPLNAAHTVVVNWIKGHPVKTALYAAGVVSGGLVNHSRRQDPGKDLYTDDYAATIARGSSSPPQGSAAGLDGGKNTWLQMGGVGYDNPAMQGARYGVENRSMPRDNPSLITAMIPGGAIGGHLVNKLRRRNRVTEDQQLSQMI